MTSQHAAAAAYERLVAELIDALRQTLPIPAGQVHGGRRSRWRGASGYEHQIDVAIDASDRLSLIECKHWGKDISTSPVLTHAARLQDIRDAERPRMVEAIIATKKGWSDAAKQLADHFGIWLWRVKSPIEFSARYHDHVSIGVSDMASGTEVGTVIVVTQNNVADANAASK